MSDITEKIKNKAKNDLDKQASPVLDNVLSYDRVKMPEEVFKGRYLDSFANGGNPEAIKEYASVAGGYRHEVDIIDSKGNVLYTTPPMLSSPDFTSMDEIKSTDLSDIGLVTQQKMNIGHMNPTKELDNTIISVEEKMLTLAKESNVDHTNKWNLIFSRYGINNDKTKNIDDNLEFDYDD